MSSSVDYKITTTRKELNAHLYVQRGIERTMAKNPSDNLGMILAQDYDVYDNLNDNRTPIGVVRGTRVHSMKGVHWYYDVNLVFTDGSFKGSTLNLKGNELWEGEWSIVGGTGEFTMATGIIYKKRAPVNNAEVADITIHAFYTPPKMSA